MTNPNSPCSELKADSSLMCVSYNLKDTSLIGGGQYNGQISVFDTRKGSAAVESSMIEFSHRCAPSLQHTSNESPGFSHQRATAVVSYSWTSQELLFIETPS